MSKKMETQLFHNPLTSFIEQTCFVPFIRPDSLPEVQTKTKIKKGGRLFFAEWIFMSEQKTGGFPTYVVK